MKIKCFSKRTLNVRKIQIFTNLQPFNFNLQQDLKFATVWENPEIVGQHFFSKNSANLCQNLQHFVKNQKKISNF